MMISGLLKMSQSPELEEEEKDGSVGDEEKEEEDEEEKMSEESGGIHEDIIDAVARGTQDPELLREQDRFLPICNISRVMRRMVPESGKMSKESKEAVQEAVSEFISFLTSEASDKCIEEQRKTITCDDLLNAIEIMGFEKYVEPLKLFLTRYREATRVDRPSGEGGGDHGTPSPPVSSTPLSLPVSTPFPHSASGPGGPIQPHSTPSTSSLSRTTHLLHSNGNHTTRFTLPPGYSMGDKGGKGGVVVKGVDRTANGHGHTREGEGEGREMSHSHHHSQPTQSMHSQIPSTDAPITVVIEDTVHKYRSVIGGHDKLAPIRSGHSNVKMIRRSGVPLATRPLDSPLIVPSTSSQSDNHQSPLISSTTTMSQSPSQSQFHPHSSSHPTYSHPPSQYRNPPVSFQSSSSTNHSSLPHPLPPISSSTNYIQLVPHSTSYLPPSTTTVHIQYDNYQDQPLMSSVESVNGGREEKKQITSSIANTKWNPSSGQYVVDTHKIGGEQTTKRRRVNSRGH